MNNDNLCISISERTSSRLNSYFRREEKIILHNGMWHIGCIHSQSDLDDFLSFLNLKLPEPNSVHYSDEIGELKYFVLDKAIFEAPYFWTIEQLQEMADGKLLKKIKGLSNGSIVDCYVRVDEKSITIYRPNPNAKDVYNKMDFEDEMEFRKTKWYI